MDRLVIWGLFCFQRWGERCCSFCGREGIFLAVGKMKHGFWQEGGGRLGMFLSLGREGWLLLVGESGDCRVILHPCNLSSLVFHSGFLSISIPFIVFLHVAHVPVGKGSPYGRRGRLLVSFSLPLSSSFFLFILHLLLFLGRVLFVLHSSLPGRCLESRDEGMDPLESWQRNGEGAVDDFALLVEEEPLLSLASHALVGHRVLAPDAPAVELLFLQ